MAMSPKSIPNKELVLEGGHKLLMSYGMFSDVMRIIGNTEDTVEILLTDNNIRDQVVRRLFTETRKPIETIEDLINSFDIEIYPYELDVIIAWVADHAMHFMMSTATKTRVVVEKYQPQVTASSNPSKTGSED